MLVVDEEASYEVLTKIEEVMLDLDMQTFLKNKPLAESNGANTANLTLGH